MFVKLKKDTRILPDFYLNMQMSYSQMNATD